MTFPRRETSRNVSDIEVSCIVAGDFIVPVGRDSKKD